MKFVLGLALGVALGSGAALFVKTRSIGASFRSSQAISLKGEGENIGILPAGYPVLSLSSKSFEPDVGWWGCLPILFADGFQARAALRGDSEKWSIESRPLIAAHSQEQ